jgi:hypothetical protein
MTTALRLTTIVAGTVLMLGAASLWAAVPGPHGADGQGTYLSYFNAPGPEDDIASVPHLRISLGGRSYGVVMDTGSTGVVVSADKIPDIERLPTLGPGKLTYSSSGRIMIGRWIVTPVTVTGANGASVTTVPIPVLAVTRVECTGDGAALHAQRRAARRLDAGHRFCPPRRSSDAERPRCESVPQCRDRAWCEHAARLRGHPPGRASRSRR